MNPPHITYRLATENDFPVMMRMYTLLNEHFYRNGYRLPHPENVGQAWLDTFRRTLGRFSNAWVAETEGRVVGFILCRIKRLPPYMGGVLVGELSDEWIEQEARRLKIGDRLCRVALEWLREQDVHSVEIQVLLSNEASWNMLSRMGFKAEFRVGRLLWDEYVDAPEEKPQE
ncbi:MAG: GNAT family N-acetyltransferase [Chloroflexi bacterium]|nr:GNAT family N-acetyltransferase [Chloroflexota bacterium]